MKLLFLNFKKIDSSIVKVCLIGLKFCFIITLVSALLLAVYISLPNLILFNIGISLLKSSLFFAVFFVICTIAIDTIKKEEKL